MFNDDGKLIPCKRNIKLIALILNAKLWIMDIYMYHENLYGMHFKNHAFAMYIILSHLRQCAPSPFPRDYILQNLHHSHVNMQAGQWQSQSHWLFKSLAILT